MITFGNKASADITIPQTNKGEIQDTWYFSQPRSFDLSEEEALVIAKKVIQEEEFEYNTMYYLRIVNSEDNSWSEKAYWSISANPPGNCFEGYYFNIYSPDGSTDFDPKSSWVSRISPDFNPAISSENASRLILDYLLNQQPFILPVLLEKTYHGFISWNHYDIERENSLHKLECYLQCHIYKINQESEMEEANDILLNPYTDIYFLLFVTPNMNTSIWEFGIAGYQDYLYDAANEISLPIYNVSKLPWGIDWNSGDLISLLD